MRDIGKVAGDEVVQVYMKPAGDDKILKQLIKFQRVHIQPGGSEYVTFEINRYQEGEEEEKKYINHYLISQ